MDNKTEGYPLQSAGTNITLDATRVCVGAASFSQWVRWDGVSGSSFKP